MSLVIGQWKDDMSHGQGAFHYKDGAEFKGAFMQDKKHGTGILSLPDGKVWQEEWREGELIHRQLLQKHI